MPYPRLLGGLLLIDGLLIALFGFVLRPAVSAGEDPAAPVATAAGWAGVDASAAGKQVGDLFLAVRKQVIANKRIELSGAEVQGSDVVVRLAMKPPGHGNNIVFPGTVYCADCERQTCQFDKSSRTALATMARAFPSDSLRALTQKVGRARIGVVFSGAAANEPIEPSTDERYCAGSNFKTFEREAGYDKYANTCGAHACEVGGQTFRVGSGDIDDPRKLACLRAFCLHRASTVSEVDELESRFAGVLDKDGAAAEPAAITLVLRDLAAPAHRQVYDRFMTAYRGVVGDWDKPAPGGGDAP